MTRAGEVPTDVLEERLIDAEYKIWKKNTPYLYDFVLTHSLEWPSLTCQWLPTTRSIGAGTTTSGGANNNTANSTNVAAVDHSLLLGTHTSGEQNYLMVASCALPQDDVVVGEDAAASEEVVPAPKYDEEKREVGGFGHANSLVGKIEIKMKIKHEGEVNRARYMPQNQFIVASRGPNPEVYIFDRSKHPSIPDKDAPFRPQAVCIGHTKEGYGMSWSPLEKGFLATGSEDTVVKLWDVNAGVASKEHGTQITSIMDFKAHQKTVEDVDWHHKDPKMIASVGDDKAIMLWDTKSGDKPFKVVANAHDDDINCVAFSPKNEYLFATGSADRKVGVWDMRNLASRWHTLESHSDQVYMVQWAPFDESILASCSSDRRVAVWDLSRIGTEQDAEDAEDGPPELLFLHGGHTSKVSDFSWNVNSDWTIASVSEDNVLQVWNMAEEIYAVEGDENDNGGDGEDGLLGEDEIE